MFEHFSYIIAENERWQWFATTKGEFFKKSKRNPKLPIIYNTIVTKSTLGKLTGANTNRSTAVVIEEDGVKTTYPSVRSAAESLFVSYQTLLDYLKGACKHSVCEKEGRKIYLLA